MIRVQGGIDTLLAVVWVGLLVAASHSYADDEPEPSSLMLGAAVKLEPKYEGANFFVSRGEPYLAAYYSPWRLRLTTDGLYFEAYTGPAWSFNLGLGYDSGRDDDREGLPRGAWGYGDVDGGVQALVELLFRPLAELPLEF